MTTMMTSSAASSPYSHAIPVVLGVILLVILPFVHIGIVNLRIWVPDKPPINRRDCTCSCFDTVFKGSYENPGNRIGYKHIYFNATANTLKIWVLTVTVMVLFYESVKRLVHVHRTSELCRPWVFLFLVDVYPHYYSWWSFFSYWNDDFYGIFYHHLFFAATEMISTALVVSMCDAAKQTPLWKLLTIMVINAVHMVAAGLDQFIANVLGSQGHAFQRSRDVGLMIPDVLHIAVSLWAVCKLRGLYAREGRPLWTRKQCYWLAALTCTGLLCCWILRYH